MAAAKKPEKKTVESAVIKSLRQENEQLKSANDRLSRDNHARYNQYCDEQQKRFEAQRVLEARQNTVKQLAERLAVAERALTQRKDDSVFSPGMSDFEMHMLVLCVTYRAGLPAFRDVDPLSVLYLRGGGVISSSGGKGDPDGLRMRHALEAEFVRRGMIDPNNVAEAILAQVKVEEERVAAAAAAPPETPDA